MDDACRLLHLPLMSTSHVLVGIIGELHFGAVHDWKLSLKTILMIADQMVRCRLGHFEFRAGCDLVRAIASTPNAS